MVRFLKKIASFLQWLLPAPFTLAVLLVLLVYVAAVFTAPAENPWWHRLTDPLAFFESGMWSLLSFAGQMMLMLVLGYVVALSDIVHRLIDYLSASLKTTAQAVWAIAFFTLSLSFINWALGLIFGAVLTREIAIRFSQRGKSFNYPLMAAAGYSGLMVWHGGLSGSAPLKIAEQGHFLENKMGVIDVGQTIFSSMNMVVAFVLLVAVPLFLWWLAVYDKGTVYFLQKEKTESLAHGNHLIKGAERLTYSRLFTWMLVAFLVVMLFRKIIDNPLSSVFTINFINLILLTLALMTQKRIGYFLKAVDKAMVSTAGILIQFPIYAGIMGMMKYSGLIDLITEKLIALASPQSFDFFVFLSAAIVNFVVPSGGGQWIVQGEIIADAAQQLHVPFAHAVMAFAYGDQLTNMLQPFWALPLLGITGLKAKQIFPYTFLLMLVGFVVFSLALWVF